MSRHLTRLSFIAAVAGGAAGVLTADSAAATDAVHDRDQLGRLVDAINGGQMALGGALERLTDSPFGPVALHSQWIGASLISTRTASTRGWTATHALTTGFQWLRRETHSCAIPTLVEHQDDFRKISTERCKSNPSDAITKAARLAVITTGKSLADVRFASEVARARQAISEGYKARRGGSGTVRLVFATEAFLRNDESFRALSQWAQDTTLAMIAYALELGDCH